MRDDEVRNRTVHLDDRVRVRVSLIIHHLRNGHGARAYRERHRRRHCVRVRTAPTRESHRSRVDVLPERVGAVQNDRDDLVQAFPVAARVFQPFHRVTADFQSVRSAHDAHAGFCHLQRACLAKGTEPACQLCPLFVVIRPIIGE